MPTSRMTLVAFCFLAACFNPDPTRRTVRCDAENPCPEAMACIDNLCTHGSTVDASSQDQGTQDLTPIGPNGCTAANGTYLGGAWACPGLFGGTSPTASQRCASGFIPCATATDISLRSCAALPGFYVANYVAKAVGSNVSCTPPSGSNRGVYGCGTGGSAQPACMGFDHAIVCSASPDWQCADQLDQIRNNNLNNGVLCCKQ